MSAFPIPSPDETNTEDLYLYLTTYQPLLHEHTTQHFRNLITNFPGLSAEFLETIAKVESGEGECWWEGFSELRCWVFFLRPLQLLLDLDSDSDSGNDGDDCGKEVISGPIGNFLGSWRGGEVSLSQDATPENSSRFFDAPETTEEDSMEEKFAVESDDSDFEYEDGCTEVEKSKQINQQNEILSSSRTVAAMTTPRQNSALSKNDVRLYLQQLTTRLTSKLISGCSSDYISEVFEPLLRRSYKRDSPTYTHAILCWRDRILSSKSVLDDEIFPFLSHIMDLVFPSPLCMMIFTNLTVHKSLLTIKSTSAIVSTFSTKQTLAAFASILHESTQKLGKRGDFVFVNDDLLIILGMIDVVCSCLDFILTAKALVDKTAAQIIESRLLSELCLTTNKLTEMIDYKVEHSALFSDCKITISRVILLLVTSNDKIRGYIVRFPNLLATTIPFLQANHRGDSGCWGLVFGKVAPEIADSCEITVKALFDELFSPRAEPREIISWYSIWGKDVEFFLRFVINNASIALGFPVYSEYLSEIGKGSLTQLSEVQQLLLAHPTENEKAAPISGDNYEIDDEINEVMREKIESAKKVHDEMCSKCVNEISSLKRLFKDITLLPRGANAIGNFVRKTD